MTNETLINLTIPFLKLSDNVRLTSDLLAEFNLTQLPVVNEQKFMGYLGEDEIADIDPSATIQDLLLNNTDATVLGKMHYFDALKLMNNYGLDLVAVIEENQNFLGSILKIDIATYISKLGFANSPGGILVISVINTGYSLAEISRIVESNDMKILCLYIDDNPEDGFESFITIKVNKVDLSRLIASLERFGYKIEADFHESSFQPIEAERLDMLMRYLNV